jgi:hypothetical protein
MIKWPLPHTNGQICYHPIGEKYQHKKTQAVKSFFSLGLLAKKGPKEEKNNPHQRTNNKQQQFG